MWKPYSKNSIWQIAIQFKHLYHKQGFEVPATDDKAKIAQDFPCREPPGSLLYLSTITRPDMSHAAGTLCRLMSKWNSKHISAAKHILRYLKVVLSKCPQNLQ
jgi:hypothetical protein